MLIKDLIEKLKQFNPNAKVSVIVNNKCEEFSLSWSGGDKISSNAVDVYVDRLNNNESPHNTTD